MDHGCHRQHHTLGPAAGHPAAQQSGRASCQLLFEGPGGDRDTFQRFRKRQLPGPQGRGSETTSANPVRGGRRRRKETRAGAEGAPRRAGARPERAQRSRAPTMLAAPSRARSPQAPWLLSASRILCLCLAVVLGWAGLLQGHPQCLDYGPPFQPLLPLEFCSDYDNFGCCDQRKDRRIAARYWDIMEYFDLKGHELCGGYIKDILCQVGLSGTLRASKGASSKECLRVPSGPLQSPPGPLQPPPAPSSSFQPLPGAPAPSSPFQSLQSPPGPSSLLQPPPVPSSPLQPSPAAALLGGHWGSWGDGSLGTQPFRSSPARCLLLDLPALDRHMRRSLVSTGFLKLICGSFSGPRRRIWGFFREEKLWVLSVALGVLVPAHTRAAHGVCEGAAVSAGMLSWSGSFVPEGLWG